MNRIRVALWNLKRYYWEPCAVEIHIADHCNLNCLGCSHYSPLAKPRFCDLDDLKINLKKLSKIRKSIGTIRLLGGEPLLNPDVSKVFKVVRNYFEQVKIELVTNGLLLKSEKLPNDFWREVRRYDVTICLTEYPINIDYVELIKCCKERGVKVEIYNSVGRFSLFQLDKEKKGSRKNYYYCKERTCFQLVGNKIFSCAQSAYVGYLNKAFGSFFKYEKGDYLTLDRISYFSFLWFRLSTRPFCKFCVFPRQQVDWRQSECKQEEWILMK